MKGLHRVVVLLGSALAFPLTLVACGGSGTTTTSCGPNSNITVKGGTITFVPQTNFEQQVTRTAVSPATISNGAIQLPISGGSFNNSSYAGSINSKGGVKLSGANGRSVSLTNFTVNTQNG